MQIEVEHKYRSPESAAFKQRLLKLGAVVGLTQSQVDTYYAHPTRNFAATDEALRIRRVGDDNFITYKGPKLDPTTKTRRELELPLPPVESGATQFGELLESLSFRPAGTVRKQRQHFRLEFQGWHVEVMLDAVDEVGDFVELELVVDQSQTEAAKQCLAALALELGLSQGERRSYLELMLEQR